MAHRLGESHALRRTDELITCSAPALRQQAADAALQLGQGVERALSAAGDGFLNQVNNSHQVQTLAVEKDNNEALIALAKKEIAITYAHCFVVVFSAYCLVLVLRELMTPWQAR